MSDAQALLERLAGLDVRIEADGRRLRINAPKGALTPELQKELVACKPELLAHLTKAAGGILPAAPDAVIPLSSGQRRLWELMRLRSDSSLYNVPMAYRLSGELDVVALQRSLAEIQRRHEVLRTSFCVVDDEPRQQVHASVALVFESADLAELDEGQQAAAVDDKLGAMITEPFELGTAPLWRSCLLRLSQEDHILVFTMHHIVFDRFSKTVFLRELETLYAGDEPPGLEIQYKDYAYWQQQADRQASAMSQLDHWRMQLTDDVQELQLPTDHARVSSTAAKGRSKTFVVPAAVTDRLNVLSRMNRASLYMTLLAALHALIYRYTGQTDQVICSPVACRKSTATEALLGYFNNIVPMRADLSGNPSFRDLLGRVRQVTLDAIRHQDAPFEQVAGLPQLAGTQLTRGMFNYRSADSGALNLANLTAVSMENRRQRADFDLALYMGMEQGALCGVIDYNAEIFDDSTIESLLRNYQDLLESVAGNPDLPLNSLPSLERRFPEIENALVRHPKVDQAKVMVRSDSSGASNLVAYVVLNEHDVPNQEELRAALTKSGAVAGEHPVFVPLDEFPKLTDGSVDVAALPPPSLTRNTTRHKYVAPTTQLEQELAEIWQRVLWREEEIGIHDDFTELGGHSLLSVQLLAETEKHLGRSLPLATLGQLTTISNFVEFLEHAGNETQVSRKTATLDAGIRDRLRSYTVAWSGERASTDALIVGLNTEGSKQPAFWIVQRYLNLKLFAEHLGPDQPIYGMRSVHGIIEKTSQNIKALVNCYVDEILEIQRSGPFIIGGICQATEIAIRTALQLIEQGHEVNLLGLQERFVPLDYAGRVAFFFGDASDRNPYYHYAWPEIGWRKYYAGTHDVHFIRGTHGTYFRDEHIQSLTYEMQLAIDNAQLPASGGEDAALLQKLSESAYRAKIAVPGSVVRDDEIRLIVAVENCSAETWLASDRSGVYLGARWVKPGNTDGQFHSRYVHCAQARTALPTDLAPGNKTELELVVIVPEDRGISILEVDMVDEGISWFSDKGSRSLQIDFRRDEQAAGGQ